MRRKTLAEHKKNGTYRADRHGNRLTMPGGDLPAMPSKLSAPSRRLWKLVVSKLPPEALSSLDAPALESMCRWFGQWQRAMERAETDNGEKCYSLLVAASMAHKQFVTLAAKFGLTPADRGKLQTTSKREAVDESNPLEMLRLIGAPKTTTEGDDHVEAV